MTRSTGLSPTRAKAEAAMEEDVHLPRLDADADALR